MVNCVVAGEGDLFLKCLRWASAEEARGLLARLNLSGVPKYFLVSSAKDTNLVFLAKVCPDGTNLCSINSACCFVI